MNLREETRSHLLHPIRIKRQIIPRRRIRNHIPTHRINTKLLDTIKRINHIPQTLRHLHPIFIKHQAIRNDRPESHTIENHRSNSMQSKEPATRLIHTLSNKISRIAQTTIQSLPILKRIMNLRIRHSPRVKPHINQVQLTRQNLTIPTHQPNLINIRAMQVNTIIILPTHISRHKAPIP